MKIDLTIEFGHPDAISHTARYARIDNTTAPNYITIAGITTSPYNIENVDNGQYRVYVKPVYADGRPCDETLVTTAPCASIISFSAVQSGDNIQVQYVAPGTVPQVYLTINYPNGGVYKQAYTNGSNGSTITVPVPSNVYGNFNAYMQSICDPDTGFYSPLSQAVTVAVFAQDTFTQISNTTSGATRTQIYETGPSVTPGVSYYLVVYSHQVTIVAVSGDTPASIMSKMAVAINATTEGQWNSSGSAPAHGTTGFPPIAVASGNQITLTLNSGNQFAGSVSL